MILNSPYISGSITVTGNSIVSGSITVLGGLSGSSAVSASYAVSASNAATASSADNLLVRNTLTAQTIVVQTITSSVDFVTGSTQFGSRNSDIHTYTGSLAISGSATTALAVNTNALFISSSGRVGMGTTNPLSILHIQSAAGSTKLTMQAPSGQPNIIEFLTNAGVVDARVKNETSQLQFEAGSSGTPIMVVSASGRVGIGTTNPVSTLQVNGNLRLYTTNGDGNELRGIFYVGGAADPLSFTMYKADASTIGAYITADGSSYFNGGNVGIGTASPLGPIHAVNTSSYSAPATTGNSIGHAIFGKLTDSGIAIGSFRGAGTSGYTWFQAQILDAAQYNNNIVFQPNGGNVGIGTSSPTAILSVEGSYADNVINLRNNDINYYAAIGYKDNSGTVKFAAGYANTGNSSILAGKAYLYTPASTDLVIATGGLSERMRITKDGNLLFNGTSDPGGIGNIYIGNTGSVPGTPSGGGVLYVQSGALKFKGSSGTITTIANA